MAAGRVGAVIVAVLGTSGFACAHLGSRPEKPTMAAGKYAVESIRSRAQLDGVDQVIEISQQGTKLVDSNGAEHVLTERGALLLSEDGACRLALAVSVDGEEPGVSDRACTWQLRGDQFLLGDAKGERIVLVERPAEYANRSVDRTSEEQAAREIQEYLHDL